MNIRHLQYLVQVVEAGSITQAAKELYISQPSLSNAITNLEKEMNIQILNRSAKGIIMTKDGEEFLAYANQVLEQVELMNRRYKDQELPKRIFSVAAHHYSFVVEAFVKLLKEIDAEHYQANLNEGRTHEIIEEVANLKSEIGVLYRSHYNHRVITTKLDEQHLTFHPLKTAHPHLFVFKKHPLAKRKSVTLADLEPYPKLSFEQGKHNSFYYWEEVLADHPSPKSIIVTDRATLFNLAIGLNGYTISSGNLNKELNGEDIVAVPLETDEEIEIGYITNDFHTLSMTALRYIELLGMSLDY